MKPYTLSLSRWHKIAERLSRLCAEQVRTAQETFNNTKVNGYYGELQVERLKSEAALQFDVLRRNFVMQEAVASIRQAVGDANVRLGVSRELATLDMLNRRLHCLEIILSAQRGEMVDVEELSSLPARLSPEERFERSRVSAKVRLLSSAMAATLATEIEVLRTKGYALADHISDLNRGTLTLELADDIAHAAGL